MVASRRFRNSGVNRRLIASSSSPVRFELPKPIAALLAVFLLAFAGPALASEAGSATGTVTVGDQATPLTHVYAWEEIDIPEMRFGDSPERRIVLLVLDRPLPANARADMGSAVQLAIKGELRGIYLDIDAATGTPHNGALLARPEENPTSFTILGDGSDVVVENFHYEGGKLELASRSVKPLDRRSTGRVSYFASQPVRCHGDRRPACRSRRRRDLHRRR